MLVLAVLLASWAPGIARASLDKILPGYAAAAVSRDDGVFVFFVAANGVSANELRHRLAEMGVDRGTTGDPEVFEEIESVVLKLSGADARYVAARQDVSTLWLVPQTIVPEYIALVRAMIRSAPALHAENGGRVVTLDVVPPAGDIDRWPADPREPLQKASRKLAENGWTIVVPVGDFDPPFGRVNPWCVAPWVICVGASDEQGRRVADGSGRGGPSRQKPGPDIVTWGGVDAAPSRDRPGLGSEQMVLEHSAQLVRQTGRAGHLEGSAPQSTAVAARRAATLASLVYLRLNGELQRSGLQGRRWVAVFDLGSSSVDREPRGPPRMAGQRFVRGDRLVVEYKVALPSAMIREILMDMARAIPGEGVESAGAGFLEQTVVESALPRLTVKPEELP